MNIHLRPQRRQSTHPDLDNKTAYFAPAKVNLLLAVTGRRPDGCHDLISLAAPVEYGDRLWVVPGATGEPDSLECEHPCLSVGEDNLVLRAASAFREKYSLDYGMNFRLEKNIPVGAGLGGGSSDAVAALCALNSLAGRPLDREAMQAMAAGLGADCPMFLHDGPVVLRGKGERVEPLSRDAARILSGLPLLIFKPEFGIDTGWAYRDFADRPAGSYADAGEIENRLDEWLKSGESVDNILFNSFEPLIFEKYLALPALLNRLKADFGLHCGMSGSGSACFALLGDDIETTAVKRTISENWGPDTFIIETRFA